MPVSGTYAVDLIAAYRASLDAPVSGTFTTNFSQASVALALSPLTILLESNASIVSGRLRLNSYYGGVLEFSVTVASSSVVTFTRSLDYTDGASSFTTQLNGVTQFSSSYSGTGTITLPSAGTYTIKFIQSGNGDEYQDRCHIDDLTITNVLSYPTATDQSGNGYNGTLAGGVTRVPDGGSLCYSFAGATDEINLGSVPALQFQTANPFTVSFWAKTANVNNFQYFFSYGGQSAAQPAWYITRNASVSGAAATLNFDFYDGSNFHRITSAVVANDTWIHVVVSRDGTKGIAGHRMWINGVEATSVTDAGLPGVLDYTGYSAKIGRRGIGTAGAAGKIDDILIWDRQLNSEEVAGLYNGRGAAYSATGSFPVVVDAKVIPGDGATNTATLKVVAGDVVYIWGQLGLSIVSPSATAVAAYGAKLFKLTAASTGNLTVTIGDPTEPAILLAIRGIGSESIGTPFSGSSEYSYNESTMTGGYSWPIGNPGAIPDDSLVLAFASHANYSNNFGTPFSWSTTPPTRLAVQSYDMMTGYKSVAVERIGTDARTPGILQIADVDYTMSLLNGLLVVLTSPVSISDEHAVTVTLPVAASINLTSLEVIQPTVVTLPLPASVGISMAVEIVTDMTATLPVGAAIGLANLQVIQPVEVVLTLGALAGLNVDGTGAIENDVTLDLGASASVALAVEESLEVIALVPAAAGFSISVEIANGESTAGNLRSVAFLHGCRVYGTAKRLKESSQSSFSRLVRG
jgi:hypothetical protein